MENMRDYSQMINKHQQNHQQNEENKKKETKPQKPKPQKPTTSQGSVGIGLVRFPPTVYSSTDDDSDVDIVH